MLRRTAETIAEDGRISYANTLASLRQKLLPPGEVGRYVREAADLTNRHLKRIALVNLGVTIGLIIVQFLVMFLVFSIVYKRLYQNILLVVLTMPVTAYALCGLLRYYITIFRGTPVSFLGHLPGPRVYINVLLFCLAYYGLYIVLVQVITGWREYDELIRVRLVLGALAFVWIHARMIFAPILILRQNLSLREALKASYVLTSKKTTQTVFLSLICAGILFAGVAALMVGVAYTLALAMLIYIKAFNNYREDRYQRPFWEEIPETLADEAAMDADERAAAAAAASTDDSRKKKVRKKTKKPGR